MEETDQKDSQKVGSLSGGVQRLEIVSGPTGRRRWSLREKARIVCETYQPDVSVSAVARRNGLRANQLFLWRRQAREGKLVLSGEAFDDFAFASVEIDENVSRSSELSSNASSMLEIESGEIVVRVREDVAAERIGEIARVLRSAR